MLDTGERYTQWLLQTVQYPGRGKRTMPATNAVEGLHRLDHIRAFS